jgi:hypothetical protein
VNAQAPAGARVRALNAALLLAAGVLYLLYPRRLFGFTPDDTFIFFRYVQNWGEGRFFVPILPLLAVLMAEGLHVLWQLVVPRLTSAPQRAIASSRAS